MSTPVKYDIFICYSRRNKNWLPKLRDILNSLKGYNYFIDESDIETAQEFDSRIEAAISSSEVAICLASPHFFQSNYITNHELPRIATKLAKNTIKVITIRIIGCENALKESVLAKYQYFNSDDYLYDSDDLEEYRDKLRQAIVEAIIAVKEAQKPLPPPPIPVSNLPEKPKWFVGYKEEKEQLKQHILAGQGLISITGDPRTGRRTLAKQAAHELLDNGDLPGGAVWIDCQKINDERALITAVGDVYLKSRAPDDPFRCQQMLDDEFSKKRCLIVLANTEDPRAGFFERWAKKIPSPSVVIDVTAPFSRPEGAPNIHLRGLDDANAEALFTTVASEALRIEKPFSTHAQFGRVREICRETQNNPLLIEVYANKCGQGFLLDDILALARFNHDTDTLTIWKNQLEPLFSGLEAEHRTAFLKLCRLPDGLSRELVQEITGLKAEILGPAIKKQFLWDLGHQRYLIDPSVRTFAETKLARPTSDVDGEVAVAFARVATAQATRIEQSLMSNREILEETVDWFRAEWENLKFCVGVAERIGDKATVCRLADSILQFMIRRGRFEDCLTLYKKALSLRDTDDAGGAKTLNDMAVCLQFKGEFVEAHTRIQESIKLQQELIAKADSPGERTELLFRLAQSWNTCGAINLLGDELGDKRLVDATKAFEAAERICGEAAGIADNDAMRTEIEIERSQTLSNLGYCFTMLGQRAIDRPEKKLHFEKALKAFNDSSAINRPGDERVGQTHSRRGQLRLEQLIWPLAERDFSTAITIFENVSNTFELGLALLGRARVLANKPSPDHDGAIKDFKRAEELFEELRDRKNQFHVLMELAKIEKVRGDSTAATAYATEASEVADKGNLKNKQKEVENFFQDLYT
ncbi:MAG: toll/interleukin-1 receptor domain-containing protein [Chloroflexales bacterium]